MYLKRLIFKNIPHNINNRRKRKKKDEENKLAHIKTADVGRLFQERTSPCCLKFYHEGRLHNHSFKQNLRLIPHLFLYIIIFFLAFQRDAAL